MKFNLQKSIVFFDIESTGLNIIKDRIVQIALIKYTTGDDPDELELLINPGIPISEEAMAVHGITPADVKNKPVFAQVAEELYAFIGDSDLAGYNSNRFDVPMLVEEFARVGIDFDIEKRKLIDIQRIFYKMEPRTLSAALRFYCKKDLEGAHDALADVRATVDVLKGQLEMYTDRDYETKDGDTIERPVRNDMDALHNFTNDASVVDVTQRLKRNPNGQVVFNFGKHIGKPVGEVLARDRQYYFWIQEKEFSVQVKKIVKQELDAYLKAHSSTK
jgi:DNA polymerase-3 subunit epsilon